MRKMMMLTGFALAAVMAVPVYAQVGQDMKNAGHDTKDATVTGAHKTAHGTKKVYHKSVSGTKHGAEDVGHDTKVTAGKTSYNTRKLGDKIAGKPTPPKSEDPHYGHQ
jgi:hypothetical protein